MRNGDTLHGDISTDHAGQLQIQTQNFGVLRIDESEIEKFSVEGDITVTGIEHCQPHDYQKNGLLIRCGEEDFIVPLTQWQQPLPAEFLQPVERHWDSSGEFFLSGVRERGNTHSDTWDISVRQQMDKGIYRHRLLGEYENDVDDTGIANERILAAYNYDVFIYRSWFANLNTSWEKDEAENLKNKTATGLGIGHQFIETPQHFLEADLGYIYVVEDYYVPLLDGSDTNEYGALRWNLEWWQKPHDKVYLFHRHQITQSLETHRDLQLKTETGIRFAMEKNLNLEVKYQWDKQGEPALGVSDTDEKWTLGVGYEW